MTNADAVLLVNLGTPAAPTPQAVRSYLGEFLSDRRVVDYPRALWLPLLHGVILNVRPKRSAKAYAEIWRRESDESPLRYYTRRQAALLAARLGRPVEWAMRYGAPSIDEALGRLAQNGARRILVVPLYPQYSTTTTASVEDAIAAFRASRPDGAKIAILAEFHAAPAYIAALAASARAHLAALAWKPDRLVLSFHGVPERIIRRGDPYKDQVETTAALLRAACAWSPEFAPLAYQSRFGPEKWLSPATDATITALARGGVKNLAVMAPGFFSDCLETLEELAIGLGETFRAEGGENFTAIPCLNDGPEAIALLENLVADGSER